MKILDREKFIEEAHENHREVNETTIQVFEAFLPLMLQSYNQGKNGKEFNILPVKEV